MGMIHCRECGVKISETANACPKCGAKQNTNSSNGSPKNHMIALMLSIFLGWLGIDRLYLGHIGLGIAKMFTFGGFGVWWFIDIILIVTKKVNNVYWE